MILVLVLLWAKGKKSGTLVEKKAVEDRHNVQPWMQTLPLIMRLHFSKKSKLQGATDWKPHKVVVIITWPHQRSWAGSPGYPGQSQTMQGWQKRRTATRRRRGVTTTPGREACLPLYPMTGACFITLVRFVSSHFALFSNNCAFKS